MSGRVIWITGLPGSGKSTIADALKDAKPQFAILRMDDLRKIVTPEPTYSESERDIVYRSIVFTAKKLSEFNHDVIIDATGNLRKWRDLARNVIPRYMEVYLKCPLETCLQRESERQETHSAPKEIYKKGKEGWPVPGTSAPYEEPLNPDIIIDTDKTSIPDSISLIIRSLGSLNE